MTKEFERIENLKKEVVRAYGEKGITDLLYDFKITLKQPVNHYTSAELYTLVLNKTVTYYRKLLSQAASIEDVAKIAESVSFGQSKVTIQSFFSTSDSHLDTFRKERIVRLLGDLIKVKVTESNKAEVSANHWPLEVTTKNLQTSQWVEKTGYTFTKDKFPKSIMKNKYALRGHKDMKYEYIFDLAVEIASAFLINSIEKYAMANHEWIQYEIASEFTLYKYGSTLDVPSEKTYREDLQGILKKHQLYPSDVIERESKYLNNRFKDAFYLTLMDGYLVKASHSDIYRWVLPEMLTQMEYLKDKTKRRLQQTSEYAKSFQTKKHINKSTLAAMKNNRFLDTFGYVELDNDVDLKLFEQLQAEFQEFCKIVYIPVVKDHSFRIKKLGRHHALGLYYPAPVKATIFDLKSPSSFAHEASHMLDFTHLNNGNLLSETLRFRRVYNQYVEAVESAVSTLDPEDPFRIKWEGNSKFNKRYYLQPEEVFARSHELHLFENKGIRSSFLKANYDGPVYPKEEQFLKSIAEYFDELFSFFQPTEKIEKIEGKAAASPKVEYIHEIASENEYLVGKQLSLF